MTAVRSHKGGAKATTLNGGITNSATSFAVAAGGGTGYPDGSTGVFVITLDAGNASEEKVLCSARTGDTFTVTTRGYDDTAAVAHVNNAIVKHTYAAVEAQEANDHITKTTQDDHTQYAKRSQGLFENRPAAGRAGARYYATDSDKEYLDDGAAWHEILTATAGNAAYPAIANFPAGAWTAYTPVLGGTGWALGNGSVIGAYRQLGKVVHFRFQITFGSTSTFGSAQLTVTVPVADQSGANFQPTCVGLVNLSGGTYQMTADVGASVARVWGGAGTLGQVTGVTATVPSTWVSGSVLRMSGTYEAA